MTVNPECKECNGTGTVNGYGKQPEGVIGCMLVECQACRFNRVQEELDEMLKDSGKLPKDFLDRKYDI